MKLFNVWPSSFIKLLFFKYAHSWRQQLKDFRNIWNVFQTFPTIFNFGCQLKSMGRGVSMSGCIFCPAIDNFSHTISPYNIWQSVGIAKNSGKIWESQIGQNMWNKSPSYSYWEDLLFWQERSAMQSVTVQAVNW